jgi:hypothetical protein
MTTWPELEAVYGDGWRTQILGRLAADLEVLDPNLTVLQVKEKFAELRVYVAVSDPSVEGAVQQRIRAAEAEASHTCERCGRQPAQIDPRYHWIITLCEACADLRAEEEAREWREYRYRHATETSWPGVRSRFGAGWTEILRDLRRDLDRIDPHLYVMQVAERDGVLAVSWWESDPELRNRVAQRVAAAAAASQVTCSRCGAPGRLRDDGGQGWGMSYTLCDACNGYWTHDRWRPWTTGIVAGQLPQRHPDEAMVLIAADDGTLHEVKYPELEQVQAVDRDGALVWLTAEAAAAAAGERAVGGAVPALVLRRREQEAGK